MGVAAQAFFYIALSKGAFGKVCAASLLGEPLPRTCRQSQVK